MRDLPFERIPGVAPVRMGSLGLGDPTLAEFCDWWAVHGPGLPQAPLDAVSFVGDCAGVVLFREERFQVQCWICRPGAIIPEHAHPSVESYEVHLSGGVTFFVEGQPVHPQRALTEPRRDGTGLPRVWGYRTYVGAGVMHHAEIGPRGGSFLSIQRWPAGVVPSSVELDWAGPYMDAGQEAKLEGWA